jgi:hypothetical protein
MRRMLAVLGALVVLVTLLYGCGKPSSIPKKRGEAETAGRPETTAKAPGGASGSTSGEDQAAQSEADCRLVLYVADQNMSRKEAEAFSELLADMIRTMEDPSWTEGELRNAALDHLAVPRYRECEHEEEGTLENGKRSYLV